MRYCGHSLNRKQTKRIREKLWNSIDTVNTQNTAEIAFDMNWSSKCMKVSFFAEK